MKVLRSSKSDECGEHPFPQTTPCFRASLIVHYGLFLALLLFCFLASAQGRISEPFNKNFLVSNWGTEQGLPQSSVTSIAQTADGYLWFGTFNGLVRFDGNRFRIFSAQNTPRLKSSRILVLMVDSRDQLWIGTETGGIHVLRNGQFDSIQFELGSITDEVIRSIAEDAHGHIWITTTHGELVCLEQGTRPIHKPAEWKIGNGFANWIVADNQGKLWLGSEKGIHQYDGTSFELVKAIPEYEINNMAPARNGGIWIGEGTKIRRFKNGDFDLKLETPVQGSIPSGLFEDAQGVLWVPSYGAGLFSWSQSVGWQQITSRDSLSHDRLRSIYQDSEQNLWIGTDGAGLDRITSRAIAAWNADDGLREEVVLAICPDNSGGVWIGTNGGGLSYLKNGAIKNYGAKEGLQNLHIWALHYMKNGALLIGTWGGGLVRFQNGEFKAQEDWGVINGVVCAIYEARDGTVYLGTQHGLVQMRGEKIHIFTTGDGLANEDIKALVEDDEGRLWIGTNGGGVSVLEHGSFKNYGKQEGLTSDIVWALHPRADGSMWIGTFGGGINIFRDGKFRSHTSANGLPDEVICKILEDRQGNIWCSSYKGVFRIHHSTLDSTNLFLSHFTRADGLPARDCSGGFQSAGFRGSDGKLWFPTVKGLAALDVEKLGGGKKDMPKVWIEECVLDGRVAGESPLQMPEKLQVKPGVQRIEFRYTGISFTKPDNVRFRYYLEGYDRDWIEGGNLRAAVYTGVSPGTYTFRVLGGWEGTWAEEGPAMTIVVLPFFWQTAWFQGLVILVLGGLTVGIARGYIARKLRRKLLRLEQQNALERERLRISRDIHDDVGSRLTEILLLADLARRNQGQPEMVHGQIDGITRTAREVVRTLDSIVWAVNPKNDNLDSFVSYISQYVEKFLSLSDLRLRLDVPPDLPHLPLTSDLRHNLFLVIKESLNNILKHAQATEVQVGLTADERQIQLTIHDNGRGFDRDHTERNGNGLINMEKRITAIGGTFRLASCSGKGTLINIHVPLGKTSHTRA